MDSHLNRNLMPIHRGRAAICGQDGRTNRRSKCVCHPSNGHGGSSSDRPTLDSHGQGWPCREWACKQASRDPMSEDCLFLRAFFTFISFPPTARRARDVVKFSTAHICRRGHGIVRYHIEKLLVVEEPEVLPRILYILDRENFL